MLGGAQLRANTTPCSAAAAHVRCARQLVRGKAGVRGVDASIRPARQSLVVRGVAPDQDSTGPESSTKSVSASTVNKSLLQTRLEQLFPNADRRGRVKKALLKMSDTELEFVFNDSDEAVRATLEDMLGDAGKVTPTLYHNITLYVLSQEQQGYDKVQKQKATRNQLQKIWDQLSYVFVARVERQPSHLLTLATCPEATDMDSVELEDGAHLALVLHKPFDFMDRLADTIGKNTEKAKELEGFKDNIVSEQENAAAAWALQQIQTEPGAQLFCFKKLSEKTLNGVTNAVKLDGVACSDTTCIIVERKQQFSYKQVDRLIRKIKTLKMLIEYQAPNTDLLQGKELRFFMMAGSWPIDDKDEQAAVRELMLQHHIQPVMPDGHCYRISWGCNLQTPDYNKRIENFNAKMRWEKPREPASLQR